MEGLKEALLELAHVAVVYITEDGWHFNKPTKEHEVKTREEILGEIAVEVVDDIAKAVKSKKSK